MTVKDGVWRALDGVVRAAQILARLGGRTRQVEAVIYKVDRLGDWLLASAAIGRIVTEVRRRGGRVVIWASCESAGLRTLRDFGCPVEAVAFEPKGWPARVRRTLAVFGLLVRYRARELYCLRHGPDPVRDFVLRTAAVECVHAVTWQSGGANEDCVPHELRRHERILRGAGIFGMGAENLLPRMTATGDPAGRGECIVVTPFSSAAIKDWPESAWCDVARQLALRGGAKWELWVGPDQLDRARGLADSLSVATERRVNVVVKSGTFADLVQALAAARLVLSVDTLAAHLATALDAPMVAILGGGQFGDFAPWSRSPRQRWVFHRLPCYHCGWACTRERNDCLQLITPDAVVAQVEAVWSSAALAEKGEVVAS